MNKFEMDKARYPHAIRGRALRFLKYFRKAQNTNNRFLRKIYKKMTLRYRTTHGLEIPDDLMVGGGLYIGHPYGITINPDAVLGENINIHKGVTIGQENRGNRKGSPTIGSFVWIGVNATIVGKITIGNDVLIAPNSYVNCDVPDHSVVYGNPCVIKFKENATENYINNVYKKEAN